MTARCAKYVSALKIVGLCKLKISRRLRKNLHITLITIRWGGEIIFEVFHPMYLRKTVCPGSTTPFLNTYDLNVTHGQTDRHCGITAR